MNIDQISRIFSEDDSDEDETSRKNSSDEGAQYQFDGFNIEFSSKVTLLPATK